MPKRRILLALPLLAAAATSGCVGGPSAPVEPAAPEQVQATVPDANLSGEKFTVAALDLDRIDPQFRSQVVDYKTSEAPGTIVVDPDAHFLYFVELDGKARRYGVAVGREGASWSGTAKVRTKQEWPDWYPTPEMLERRPDIKAMLTPLQSGPGIAGGPDNPIGARGLYLWQGEKDTLYRIHGTTEPYSIGTSASSGCIRMTNQDVIDLYARVPVGATVRVLPTTKPARQAAVTP